MPSIYLNSLEIPVKSVKRSALSEFASAIREGTPRRTDRALADFRTEGEVGYPLGLGYRWGPAHIVAGGIASGELRVETPGLISLPLEMESETESAGDLSGEVAAAGRMSSCNTDLGNSSGLKRLYVAVGTKLLRTVSDTDFTLEDSTYTVATGVARIYWMAEIHLNNTRYLAIGTEDPTTTAERGIKVTTNPTATPPVFADLETLATDTDGPGDSYWGVSIDSLQRTYLCWYTDGGAVGTWGDDGRAQMGYLGYADALSATPTILYTATTSPLHRGCQIAGVIGERIWLIDPLQDAQASPNVTKRLVFIDIARAHLLVEVPLKTTNVTLAARYDHPAWGKGIVYTDGTNIFWTNGDVHMDLDPHRYQGRTAAYVVKGFNPTGDRLGVLFQVSTTSAYYEEYIPTGTIASGVPNGGIYGGCWYPFSKRITTDAGLILPGGTERGCTIPWGAEGKRRYFVNPSATTSTIWRQLHYGLAADSNPLTKSLSVDDFEDGPLSAEFPLYDAWGGVEEAGVILQGYFEGGFNAASGAPSADETVLWEYTTDQSTYPDFTTFTTADTTSTLSTPASARRFGTRVTLNRGSTATKTPNGAIFVVRGLKEPGTRYVHTFDLDIEAMLATNNVELPLLQSRLQTMRDAGAVLLKYDVYSANVYVSFDVEAVPAEGLEQERIVKASISCVEVS